MTKDEWRSLIMFVVSLVVLIVSICNFLFVFYTAYLR
jgi:hypothetical protein